MTFPDSRTLSLSPAVTLTAPDVQATFYLAPAALAGVESLSSYRLLSEGLSNLNRVGVEFAVGLSKDPNPPVEKVQWGPWQNLQPALLNAACNFPSETVALRLRVRAIQLFNPAAPVRIKGLELGFRRLGELGASQPTADEVLASGAFREVAEGNDLYTTGDAQAATQAELNLWLNQRSQTEVLYFRTAPDKQSTDAVLNEYSLKNVLNPKGTRLRVVIPDNEIPEPKHTYDEWGANFDQFEIQIDKGYFTALFGTGARPRDKDYLYLIVARRMYRVVSNYLDRGTNETETYFALSLKNWDDDSSIGREEETDDFLGAHTLRHEDIFAEELEEARADAAIHTGGVTTMTGDRIREAMHADMQVLEAGPVLNNSTELLRHFYDLSLVPCGEPAIRYASTAELLPDASAALAAWIRVPSPDAVLTWAGAVPTRVDHNRVLDVAQLTFNPAEVRRLGTPLVLGSYLTDGTRFWEVADAESLSEGLLLVHLDGQPAPGLLGPVHRAERRNLLAGLPHPTSGRMTLAVDLLGSRLLRVRTPEGRKLQEFTLDASTFEADRWTGLVLNFSAATGYLGLYTWIRVDRSTGPAAERASTRLQAGFRKELAVPSASLVLPTFQPQLLGASDPLHLSNLRLYRRSVEQEEQSLALSVRTVPKPSIAFVIDNTEPIHNLPKNGSGFDGPQSLFSPLT